MSDLEWGSAIFHSYLFLGDTRPLAELIRIKPIPDKYREAISKIVNGDLKPSNLNNEARLSYDKKQYYDYLITVSHALNGNLTANESWKIWIIERFALEFYNNDINNALRIINRKIKYSGWKPLPSF